jgi:hypothetical protein
LVDDGVDGAGDCRQKVGVGGVGVGKGLI